MATKNRENGMLEESKNKIKLPPLYKVMLLNDDFTPMDFVVMVLQNFFFMSQEKATQIMLVESHAENRAWVGYQLPRSH